MLRTCSALEFLLISALIVPGSHGDTGADNDRNSCEAQPAPVFTARRGGLSLVQALALNGRVSRPNSFGIWVAQAVGGIVQNVSAPQGMFDAHEKDWFERGKNWSITTPSLLRHAVEVARQKLSNRQRALQQSIGISDSVLLLAVILAFICCGVCLCIDFPALHDAVEGSADHNKFTPTDSVQGALSGSMRLPANEVSRVSVPYGGSGDEEFETPSRGLPTVARTGLAAVGNDVGPAAASFCPDLVVPEQCECILLVPTHAPAGAFPICDVHGQTVLCATTREPRPGSPWQVALQSMHGETLAYCREFTPSATSAEAGEYGAEFRVLDAAGEYFASLVEVGRQRFELATKIGFRLCLWGNFDTLSVNVTDFRGDLLATTEPCQADSGARGVCYRLRVAPTANVGHSLCALLCIGQILEARKPNF